MNKKNKKIFNDWYVKFWNKLMKFVNNLINETRISRKSNTYTTNSQAVATCSSGRQVSRNK